MRLPFVPRLLPLGYAIVLALMLVAAWLVRDQPIQPESFGGLVRLDALGAFFALLTLLGAGLAVADGAGRWRTILVAGCLITSYLSTHLLAVGLCYLLATLLEMLRNRWREHRIAFRAVSDVIAPLCLLLAYTLLRLHGGTWRYDQQITAQALDSETFWFVLLAAVLGGQPLLRTALGGAVRAQWPRLWQQTETFSLTESTTRAVWALLWLYPLVRLYSFGPWNAGWSLATLLLGAALALWCATRAIAAHGAGERVEWVAASVSGLAMAGAGLSSAAGIATCCYSLLCVLLLLLGLRRDVPPITPWSSLWLWPLSGALPITAPFVATWLGIGAATAGGVLLVAGALWGAGLTNTLAVLRTQNTEHRTTEPRTENREPRTENSKLKRSVIAAVLSVVGGVTAPLLIQWPIAPVAQQLQAGLTPFGDLTIWPWVGLAALDSGRQPVASLPSFAVGALMLVMSAMAWLVLRLVTSRMHAE